MGNGVMAIGPQPPRPSSTLPAPGMNPCSTSRSIASIAEHRPGPRVRIPFAPPVSRQTIGSSVAEPHLPFVMSQHPCMPKLRPAMRTTDQWAARCCEPLSAPPPDSNGVGDRPQARMCGEPSSPADRNKVVHADALHDEKLARAVGLPVHVMRGLRRHRTALARQETIDEARSPCLDHHRPLKTNEAVADLSVVMPRHALAGRKGQHLHAQIRTLGDQLVAGDRVIAAVARLHRSVLDYPDSEEDFRS